MSTPNAEIAAVVSAAPHLTEALRPYKRHVRERLEWVSDTLSVYGYVNAVHVRRRFGVSESTAVALLASYRKIFPGDMEYSGRMKVFFRPTSGILVDPVMLMSDSGVVAPDGAEAGAGIDLHD